MNSTARIEGMRMRPKQSAAQFHATEAVKGTTDRILMSKVAPGILRRVSTNRIERPSTATAVRITCRVPCLCQERMIRVRSDSVSGAGPGTKDPLRAASTTESVGTPADPAQMVRRLASAAKAIDQTRKPPSSARPASSALQHPGDSGPQVGDRDQGQLQART